MDFSNLGPLKAGGTVGFSTFRDQITEASRRRKARKKSNGNIADDSDEEDDDSESIGATEDTGDKDEEKKLSPEDTQFSGELADGVNRIRVSPRSLPSCLLRGSDQPQLKRAHSADPEPHTGSEAAQGSVEAAPSLAPPVSTSLGDTTTSPGVSDVPADGLVGSPLKKARPSMSEPSVDADKQLATQSLSEALDVPVSGKTEAVVEPSKAEEPAAAMEDEEEL